MNQIYCSNCGQLIPGNSNFCTFCGVPQHGPDAGAFRAQAAPVADAEEARANSQVGSKTPPEIYQRQTLGSDAIVFFLISNIAKTSILLLLFIVGAILMPKIFIFFLIAYFFGIIIGTLLIYNNFQFEINEKGIEIQTGVIEKSEVSLPFDSIENVNIERTLADRFIGTSRISIETAGSALGNVTNGEEDRQSRAEAYLPGLPKAKAEKIHDLLIDASDGIFGN
jgi:membrane protein YdbS with pleckstrin-like domain